MTLAVVEVIPFHYAMPLLEKYPQLQIIRDISKKEKISVFLVGGFLRDSLLGRRATDLDFAVERQALKIAKAFAKQIRGAFVLLDEDRGCARIAKKIKGELYTFDFADFRADTLRKDLSHRDFTVNTLAIDICALAPSDDIISSIKDYKGGMKDLHARRIKMVSARAFKEDPLRMLRAFSLRASLGFRIEKDTLDRIKKESELITIVSYERICTELFKILGAKDAGRNLKALARVGLLDKIIPQVKVMYGCRQKGTYHHLDIWPHSLETVVQLDKIISTHSRQGWVGIGGEDMAAYLDEPLGGNRSRMALMKLAALLHDIGKPDTRRQERGKLSFHGHERAGQHIVRHIAGMLKLSTKERFAIEDMVRWHLRPGYLSDLKQVSERAVYRYFRDAKEEAVSILLLSMADQKATRGPLTSERDQRRHEELCKRLIKKYFYKKREKPFVRLINGYDLINTLKLKPSPLFSEILSAVEEQQALGKIATKQDALLFAKKMLNGIII